MDGERLPAPVQAVLKRLAQVISARQPAISASVCQLRATRPHLTNDQLAQQLIRSTRRRVAATGALSGATAIAPGLGTLVAVGTITGQTFYALEQEVELVLAIAMIYGHDLAGSDERVIEALLVVGLASGAVKLREDVLVAGGERIALAAFSRLPGALAGRVGSRVPGALAGRVGSRVLTRILARFAASGAANGAARLVPLAVGMAAGAGFDWVAVTGLGRAAMKYYGPGGPGARPLLLAPEDPLDVELGS